MPLRSNFLYHLFFTRHLVMTQKKIILAYVITNLMCLTSFMLYHRIVYMIILVSAVGYSDVYGIILKS